VRDYYLTESTAGTITLLFMIDTIMHWIQACRYSV